MTTYGPEVEGLLIDSNGQLVRGGSAVVKALDDPFIMEEHSDQWVEIGARNSSSVVDLVEGLLSASRAVHSEAQKNGAAFIPLSTPVGEDFTPAYSGKLDPAIRQARSEIFGVPAVAQNSADHMLGLHYHIDTHEDLAIQLRQLHLLTAMDPLTVVTASSPFLRGSYRGNDPRIIVQRSCATPAVSKVRTLNPYASSIENYEDELDALLLAVQSELANKGFDKDIAGCDKYRNIYGPIRRCLEGKKNTVEHRAASAGLLSDTAAYMTTMKAFNELVVSGTPLVFTNSLEDAYTLSRDGLRLPEWNLLHSLEAGKQLGYTDRQMHQALTNMYQTALAHAPAEEQAYLEPIARQLATRQNTSDKLLWCATQERAVTDRKIKEGAEGTVRLLYADMYEQDICTLGDIPDNRHTQPYRL